MITLIQTNPAAWFSATGPAVLAQPLLSADFTDLPFLSTSMCTARFVLVLVIEMIA